MSHARLQTVEDAMQHSNEFVQSKESIHEFITGLHSPASEDKDLSDSVGILPDEEQLSQDIPHEATTILYDSASSALQFGSHADSTVSDAPTRNAPTPLEKLNTNILSHGQHDAQSASQEVHSRSAGENERSCRAPSEQIVYRDGGVTSGGDRAHQNLACRPGSYVQCR